MLNYIKTTLHKTGSAFLNHLRRPVQPCKHLEAAKEILCTREDMKLTSSSGVVFHIKTDTLDGYFYECRAHKPIQNYVFTFIEDYYSLIYTEHPMNETDKDLILTSLSNSENLKKFIAMGIKYYNADTPCMEFLRTGNGKAIGLDINEKDIDQINRLKKFVGEYAWCQLNSYHLNKNTATNKLQTWDTNIALASQEVAKLLKLDHLFPKAEYVQLNIDNKKVQYGLFVETAPGTSILPFCSEDRKAKITPELQRDLTQLNLLDVITYEQDHSPNNYNVIMNEDGYIAGISSFDNKSVGAFALRTEVDFVSFKNCSPFVGKDGVINRPFLNKTLIERIEALKYSDLLSSTKGLIRPFRIRCTWERIKRLKKAISKTMSVSEKFAIDDTYWSEITVEQELSGEYGKTYLISFYSDVFIY